jgi:hypothetical protein
MFRQAATASEHVLMTSHLAERLAAVRVVSRRGIRLTPRAPGRPAAVDGRALFLAATAW